MHTFGITLDATYEGIDVSDDGWQHNRWTVTLTRGGPFTPHRTMSLVYRTGMAIEGPPELSDVLESVQSDARTIEWGELDDVLDDMPYSKARKIADAMERQTRQLRRFFGDDFDAFMSTDLDES